MVITVSNTAVPTVSAIVSCSKPIYVDINESDYLINTSLIESKITKNKGYCVSKSLWTVSKLWKYKKIAKYNIKVIEDCAQSSGAL